MEIGTMLVDDDPGIRMLMRMVIKQAASGIVVRAEAANGEQALALLEDADPDVIVLDQMMPRMTGMETAARILERRPQQRMVFCSAHRDDALFAQALAMGFVAVIAKDRIAELPEVVLEAMAT